jgi:protein-tyrosine kinase
VSKIYDALRKAEREKQGHRKKTPIKAKRSAKAKASVSASDMQRDSRLLDGLEENFRRSLMTLRNAVESEIKDRETRLIVFTSAVKGEGKTTILSAFSRVLAVGGGKRLCVVDCSVRSPELHSLFGVDNDVGVIDYLGGEAELEAIIHDIEGIHFIPAGVTANIDISIPLFNSDRMSQFMRQLSETYDYVLIDTSAILEAPETPIISSYSDGVILVVHTGSTRREVIKRAMLLVEKLDGRFIGTILNRKRYYIPEFIYRRV